MSSNQPIRILKLSEVLQRVRVGKTTLYSWISKGMFPKQIKYGHCTAGWVESEIDEWIREKIRLRDTSQI